MRYWILVGDKFINVDHIHLGEICVALKPGEYDRVIKDLLNLTRKEVKLPDI